MKSLALSAPKSKSIPGQVLVSVLLVLLVVGMTVVFIVATTYKDSAQVVANSEYKQSYNRSEGTLLSIVDKLAGSELDFNNLEDLLNASCQQVAEKYICRLEGVDGTQVVTIYETNEVTNYVVGKDNYFDIILSSGSSTYQGDIEINWANSADVAMEGILIYEDNQGRLQNVSDTFDGPAGVFNRTPAQSTIFNSKPVIGNDNTLNLNMSDLRASIDNNLDQLLYLRLKVLSRQSGVSLNIRPTSNNGIFPDQVRKIEVISYDNDDLITASPVVETQLPLSPPVPSFYLGASTFKAVNSPICGNGVVEAREFCDDGNSNDNDSCPNDCRACPADYKTNPALTTRTQRVTFNRDVSGCAVTPGPEFNRLMIARREFTQFIDPNVSGNDLVCGFDLDFPSQQIEFDDDIFITLGDYVLMTNIECNLDYLEKDDGLEVYDWSRLEGNLRRFEFEFDAICGDRQDTGCLGGVQGDTNRCRMPASEMTGEIYFDMPNSVNSTLVSKLDLSQPQPLRIAITGDNDPTLDCRLYADLAMDVTYYILE